MELEYIKGHMGNNFPESPICAEKKGAFLHLFTPLTGDFKNPCFALKKWDCPSKAV